MAIDITATEKALIEAKRVRDRIVSAFATLPDPQRTTLLTSVYKSVEFYKDDNDIGYCVWGLLAAEFNVEQLTQTLAKQNAESIVEKLIKVSKDLKK